MAHEFHAIKYLDGKGDLVKIEAYSTSLDVCEKFAKNDLLKPWYNYQYYIIYPITESEFKELTTV